MITNHNNVRAASCYMHAILFSVSHTLSGGLLFCALPFTVLDLVVVQRAVYTRESLFCLRRAGSGTGSGNNKDIKQNSVHMNGIDQGGYCRSIVHR